MELLVLDLSDPVMEGASRVFSAAARTLGCGVTGHVGWGPYSSRWLVLKET